MSQQNESENAVVNDRGTDPSKLASKSKLNLLEENVLKGARSKSNQVLFSQQSINMGGRSQSKLSNSQTSLTGSKTRLAGSVLKLDGSMDRKLNILEETPTTMNLKPEQFKTVEFSVGTLSLFMIDNAIQTEQGAPNVVVKPERLIFHFVSTPNILADIQTRGSLSEFQTIFNEISECKLDEILLIYVESLGDKHKFMVLYHIEAINEFCKTYGLTPHFQVLEDEGKKAIWQSLGSEKEIEEEKEKPTRNNLKVIISKQRKEFGKPYKFQDRDAMDSFQEFKSYKGEPSELLRAQRNIGIQVTPFVTGAGTQTNTNRPVNFSCQYEPREFDSQQIEAILKDPNLSSMIEKSLPVLEHTITGNIVIDAFKNNFLLLGEDDVGIEHGAQVSLLEYQSFTDLKHSKDKSISCIDWHPQQKGIVAMSCTDRCTLEEKIEMGYHAKAKSSVLLLWNFNDPIHPQLILEGPDEIQCFKFNPSNSSIIVAGCLNGQIIIWDISEFKDKLMSKKKGEIKDKSSAEIPIAHHVSASSIEYSHRAAVIDLQWISKNIEIQPNGEVTENSAVNEFNQFVSTSLDGQVLFWDLRFRKDLKSLDLVWRPFIKVPLSSMDNTFDYGCTKVSLSFRTPSLLKGKGNAPNHLDYSVTDKSQLSKFFCGTEEGDLLYSDWIAEKTEEKSSRVEHAWHCHFGMITDLQRSPFFTDVLLSVGGWCFHIWKEGLGTGPLISSHIYSSYLTGGKWSPSRPGVFYIAKSDGSIEAWDITDRSHEPSMIQNISTSGLTHITLHVYQGSSVQYLAAGDDNGTLHILQVPKLLSKSSKNETLLVKAFFEREIKRIKYMEDKKTAKLLEKKEDVPTDAAQEPKKAEAKQEESNEANEEQLEQLYKAMERDFMERIKPETISSE